MFSRISWNWTTLLTLFWCYHIKWRYWFSIWGTLTSYSAIHHRPPVGAIWLVVLNYTHQPRLLGLQAIFRYILKCSQLAIDMINNACTRVIALFLLVHTYNCIPSLHAWLNTVCIHINILFSNLFCYHIILYFNCISIHGGSC